MATVISLLALLATFYQLYLQRVHNEKSLKPLVQIDLMDRGKLLYVRIQNNGVGPLIVEKLTFLKNGKSYSNLEDCLELSPRSYQHLSIIESVKKVLVAGSYLEVFSKQFEESSTDEELDSTRRQLAALTLRMDGLDIYNNKVTVERDLRWFMRHHTVSDVRTGDI